MSPSLCRPIHDAIEVGSLELVKLLIRYGADPLAEQGEKTPVEFALDMEQPEIHDYLQCEWITERTTSVLLFHPKSSIVTYIGRNCLRV